MSLKLNGPHPLGLNLEARSLASNWKPLKLVVAPGADLPDAFEWGGMLVVSDRLRKVLSSARGSIEFLPVEISNGQEIDLSRSVLHLTSRTDCIDLEQSVFEMYGEPPNFSIKRFKKLVFDSRRLGNLDVFRPTRYPAIYVSGSVKDACAAKNITVRMIKTEGASAAI